MTVGEECLVKQELQERDGQRTKDYQIWSLGHEGLQERDVSETMSYTREKNGQEVKGCRQEREGQEMKGEEGLEMKGFQLGEEELEMKGLS